MLTWHSLWEMHSEYALMTHNYYTNYFSLCSVILSHLQCLSHADIQHNQLMLFVCDGGIEEMEIDAEGGVVAGDLTIKGTLLHS